MSHDNTVAFGSAKQFYGVNDMEYESIVNELKAKGIENPVVLAAMNTVPRRVFIEPVFFDEETDDLEIPPDIGDEIVESFLVAKKVEFIVGNDPDNLPQKVLEIGVGKGFQSAVLAEIVEQVFSVERSRIRCKQIDERLRGLEVMNVKIVQADGQEGYPDQAPYDGIIVNVVFEEIPEALKHQLKDGGRMVIPLGNADYQILYFVTRNGSEFEKKMMGAYHFNLFESGVTK